MTDTLHDIVERLKKMPHDKKMELAKLASEAFAKRRAHRST